MTTKYFIFAIILCFCNLGSINAQEIWQPNIDTVKAKYENVILRESDLPKVLTDIPKDKILQVERLASYLFHQLLNQYRISNNIKPLEWDDRLWLAARNHNIYMANVEFGHEETNKGSKYYTGRGFSGRVGFVMNSDEYFPSTENIQYFYSNWLRYYVVGLPEKSINGWKTSPGHNANMLNGGFTSEGTSIYIDRKSENVYGTTVFSFNPLENSKPITISWSTVLQEIYKNYTGEENYKYYGNELKLGN